MMFGGRATVNVEYDTDWFHKKAEFWGYNDVFEAEKCIIENNSRRYPPLKRPFWGQKVGYRACKHLFPGR